MYYILETIQEGDHQKVYHFPENYYDELIKLYELLRNKHICDKILTSKNKEDNEKASLKASLKKSMPTSFEEDKKEEIYTTACDNVKREKDAEANNFVTNSAT